MDSIQPSFKNPTWGKPIPDYVCARAQSNVTMDEETGCFISNYHRNPSGYALLSIKPKGEKAQLFLAHRAAWTFHNGPIPHGMTVDHICFNKACVNPAHLRLLTNQQNAARRDGYDFPLGAGCGNGHGPEFRESRQWGKVPAQSFCTLCLKEKNDRNTTLARLEKVYGIRLTKRQREMYDEFMPQYELVA